MRAVRHIPQYTVEDYQQWEGDWELIDGIPYAMSPSASYNHQVVAGDLFTDIKLELRKEKERCGNCKAVYEVDWIVDNSTVLRPDIAIVCDNSDKFIGVPPVLIIEFLSPSTAYKDRTIKFEIYQAQGVRYYLIVNSLTKKVQPFELVDGEYQEQSNLTSFEIHEKCTIQLNAAEILARL